MEEFQSPHLFDFEDLMILPCADPSSKIYDRSMNAADTVVGIEKQLI